MEDQNQNTNVKPDGLRANSLEWFFAKTEKQKEELKEKHFADEYISYDSQWGYHFTFGQIEDMYIAEHKNVN